MFPAHAGRKPSTITTVAAIRVLGLVEELQRLAPQKVKDAQLLAENVVDPETADADAIWSPMWEKPLYANNRYASADAKRDQIAPMMKKAWRLVGQPGSSFEVFRKKRGYEADCFHVSGSLAHAVRACGVAHHRMYAIQNAAKALRYRVEKSHQAPYAELGDMPIKERIWTISSENGEYWGPITATHFLTDLGLAIKADRWVVRAVCGLGILPDISPDRTPNLPEIIVIIEAVENLVSAMFGKITPYNLRWTDKVLMSLAEYGLLGSSRPEHQNAKRRTSRPNCNSRPFLWPLM